MDPIYPSCQTPATADEPVTAPLRIPGDRATNRRAWLAVLAAIALVVVATFAAFATGYVSTPSSIGATLAPPTQAMTQPVQPATAAPVTTTTSTAPTTTSSPHATTTSRRPLNSTCTSYTSECQHQHCDTTNPRNFTYWVDYGQAHQGEFYNLSAYVATICGPHKGLDAFVRPGQGGNTSGSSGGTSGSGGGSTSSGGSSGGSSSTTTSGHGGYVSYCNYQACPPPLSSFSYAGQNFYGCHYVGNDKCQVIQDPKPSDNLSDGQKWEACKWYQVAWACNTDAVRTADRYTQH